jgi:hypothetical protein
MCDYKEAKIGILEGIINYEKKFWRRASRIC